MVVVEKAWLDDRVHQIRMEVSSSSAPPKDLDLIELCPQANMASAKCISSDVKPLRRSVSACVAGKSGPSYAGVLSFQLPPAMQRRADENPESFFSRQGGELYLLFGRDQSVDPVPLRPILTLGGDDPFAVAKLARRKQRF